MAELSFNDKKRLVEAALTQKFALIPETYVWIRDMYDTSVIWSQGPEMFRTGYILELSGEVVLGEATAVMERTEYLDVVVAPITFFEGGDAVQFSEDKQTVVRTGKLFEVGSFPDKSFSLTEAELAAAVDGFIPVPVDYEHVSGPLDGKLGEVTQVWLSEDKKSLMGSVTIPHWLHSTLGAGALKVSTTWNKGTKHLSGLALVNNPRITDAALFAAFAGKRHSNTDLKDFQSVHDLMVIQGAICPSQLLAKTKETVKMSVTPKKDAKWYENFGRLLFGAVEEPTEEMKEEEPKLESTAPKAGFSSKVVAEADPRIKALEDELAQVRQQGWKAEAAMFASNEVTSHRAYPAEASALAEAYLSAAQDDYSTGSKVTFSTAEGSTEVTRVEALKKRQATRPAHNLTQGETKVQVLFSENKVDTEGVSPETVTALLSLSPLGQTILKDRK